MGLKELSFLELLLRMKHHELGRLMAWLAETVAGIPEFLWWRALPGLVAIGAIVLFIWALNWKTRGVFRVLGALGAVVLLWAYWNVLATTMVMWGYLEGWYLVTIERALGEALARMAMSLGGWVIIGAIILLSIVLGQLGDEGDDVTTEDDPRR